jgi:hypothetical protein
MRCGFCVCLLLAACGQGSSAKQTGAMQGAMAPSTGGVSSLADESCPGFPLAGLKYSPGGTVLPHACRAFDALTNNPYAVRCVDVMPNFKTQYPGDEFCILPPPPDQGVQIGAHPQGPAYWDKMYAGDYSDYANAALTQPFELGASSEVVQNFDVTAPNTQVHSYFRIDSRMRSGSHHLASWFNSPPVADGWEPATANETVKFGTNVSFYNVQNTHSDRPSASELPPEDQGLGLTFPANASVTLQLHHINVNDTPILREVWINVWWVPDGQTVTPVGIQALLANVNYPPNQIIDNTKTFVATGDMRIVSEFGHRHAWTTRFSAQLTRANGDTREMYDSFSWMEMPTYQLDSVTTNPQPNIAGQGDGAMSGLTVLHQGDKVTFDCHAETTAAAAAKLGVPMPTSNLQFKNESFGGEMCIFYLETTGATLMAAAQ